MYVQIWWWWSLGVTVPNVIVHTANHPLQSGLGVGEAGPRRLELPQETLRLRQGQDPRQSTQETQEVHRESKVQPRIGGESVKGEMICELIRGDKVMLALRWRKSFPWNSGVH